MEGLRRRGGVLFTSIKHGKHRNNWASFCSEKIAPQFHCWAFHCYSDNKADFDCKDHADQTLTKYNLTQQFLTPLHQTSRPIGITRNEAVTWGCLVVFGVAAALSSCLFLTFWTCAGSEGLTHKERNWGVKESRMYNLGSDRGRKDKL